MNKHEIARDRIEKTLILIKKKLIKFGVATKDGKLKGELWDDIKNPKNRESGEIEYLIIIAHRAGAALEYLGKIEEAQDYYATGCYGWTDDKRTEPSGDEKKEFVYRDVFSSEQLTAAICNDRAGNKERAKQLYELVAKNKLTDEEVEGFMRGSGPYIMWEQGTTRAYALLCLNRYEEALEVAEDASRWFKKDDNWEEFGLNYSTIFMMPVVLAVARWKANPTKENERNAKEMLDMSRVEIEENLCCLTTLFELLNLRAKFL